MPMQAFTCPSAPTITVSSNCTPGDVGIGRFSICVDGADPVPEVVAFFQRRIDVLGRSIRQSCNSRPSSVSAAAAAFNLSLNYDVRGISAMNFPAQLRRISGDGNTERAGSFGQNGPVEVVRVSNRH